MNNTDSKEIIVIYKEVGEIPVLKKVTNSKETFELLVGGEIDILPYEDIFIICRKDGEKLKPNISVNTNYGKANFSIRGTVLIINKDNEEFKSLSKEQAIKYAKFLVMESFKYEHFDENGRYLSNRELRKRRKNQENKAKLPSNNNFSQNGISQDNIINRIASIPRSKSCKNK